MVNMNDYFNSSNSRNGMLSFLVANVPKAERNDGGESVNFSLSRSVIRHALEDNDNKYMLFLLYTSDDKRVIDSFFEKKGAYINNYLGSDINLYTNYSRETYEKWGSVKGRKVLDNQDFGDEKDFSSMLKLAHAFGLNPFTELPALVFVDKTDTSKFASINLKNKNEDEISSAIIGVKNNIDLNYGNFDEICKCLSTTVTKSTALLDYTEKVDTYTLIADYVDKNNMSYKDLAAACNITEKRLSRIRNKVDAKINRDEIITIALSLGMSEEDTNDMLYSYDLADLRLNNIRDAVFIEEIKKNIPANSFRLYEISDNLEGKKLLGLPNFKS